MTLVKRSPPLFFWHEPRVGGFWRSYKRISFSRFGIPWKSLKRLSESSWKRMRCRGKQDIGVYWFVSFVSRCSSKICRNDISTEDIFKSHQNLNGHHPKRMLHRGKAELALTWWDTFSNRKFHFDFVTVFFLGKFSIDSNYSKDACDCWWKFAIEFWSGPKVTLSFELDFVKYLVENDFELFRSCR